MSAALDTVGIHHFSLNFDKSQITKKFQDVRLVLVAGCWRRAQKQAKYLAEKLSSLNDGTKSFELQELTNDVTRFKLFKVGPALVADHGMGGASMSIAIHELLLMCRQASVLERVTVIRFGTIKTQSIGGGLGPSIGNLSITDRAVDPLLNEFVDLKIVGKIVRRPCVLDTKTNGLIMKLLSDQPNFEELGHYEVNIGATLASNDFYEEQGRTNGIICDHTIEDKMKFLEGAKEFGVVNFEMESTHLAAMCHKVGIKFAIVCVVLTNRLVTDLITLTSEQMDLFEKRLFWMNYLVTTHLLDIEKKQ